MVFTNFMEALPTVFPRTREIMQVLGTGMYNFLGKGLEMLFAEEPGKGLILVDELNEEITLFSKVILNVIDHLHE